MCTGSKLFPTELAVLFFYSEERFWNDRIYYSLQKVCFQISYTESKDECYEISQNRTLFFKIILLFKFFFYVAIS